MKRQVKRVAKKVINESTYNRIMRPKHYGVAVAANIKHRFPAKDLQVIGVTGTNGKTSTCFLIHKMLAEAGIKTGMMTTVAYGVDDDIKQQMAHMTSQPIEMLLSRIEKLKAQGMQVLVLEVTSHALEQFRVMGVPIDIAVMTNVTHEHLDYHGTFQRYVAAKVKLFKRAASNKKGHQLGIINADDDNAAAFADAVPNVLAYSLDEKAGAGVAHPAGLKLTPKGSSYTLKIKDDSYKIVCNLPGSFNVANSLAAALVGRAIGLDKKQIEQGIAALDSVEGRMVRVDEGQNFDVIVDYAHTPDSYEKLLSDIRPMVKGKLIVMFGSLGGGDTGKRPIQGKLASEYAEQVIVCEEDDRNEDPAKIMNDIAAGAESVGKTQGKDLFLIHDRTKAIKFALLQAKKGDTVLLLGKGHEKTIERADGERKWDEVGTTRRLLKQLTNAKN